jgi:hypothetical protein
MDLSALSGRIAFGLTLMAGLYGLALLAWAAAIPSIDGETLVEYGGPMSLVLLSQSLLAAGALWALLRRRCTTGSRGATAAAWLFATLFLAWSVLGALSFAAGALPAAAVLLLATAVTPRPA